MAAIVLAGSASMRKAPDHDLEVMPWAERLTALQALRHFDLQGRVAVTNGTDGFSAGLRWQQNDDQALVDLSAPLGFGAAHIQQTDNILRVTTSKGVTLDSDAATTELRSLLGFDAPLRSLRYWIVGASDPQNPSEVSLDSLQRLTRLDQEGWRIDYGDYTAVRNTAWLPLSLTVTHETLKLKIVIHDWQLYSLLGD
jgi:outer membrane lipoprotein LolB